MPYRVILKPGAEADIDDAYNWYEDQQLGLGKAFLDELVFYYKKLEAQPTSFHKVIKKYRQAALKRFPFVIVFEIEKTDVVIYSVFHTSRNPKNKLQRKK
jgi:plasmid stabilization system protein ParE